MHVLTTRNLREASSCDYSRTTIDKVTSRANRRLVPVAGRLNPSEEQLLQRSRITANVIDAFGVEILRGLNDPYRWVIHVRQRLIQEVGSRSKVRIENSYKGAIRHVEGMN